MSEKDWHMLVQLYKDKKISTTAKKLFISQPALTYQLKQLEKKWHIKIVERDNKGVIFTEQGEKLVSYCKNMLKQLHLTKEIILNMSDELRGTVKLGVSSNFAHYELPNILLDFNRQYPEINIEVVTGWTDHIIDLLNAKSIHIGIIRGQNNWSEGRYLLTEEPVVAASKSKIFLNQLPILPRIAYKTDALFHSIIKNWWYDNYKTPPISYIQADQVQTCKELVKKGLGYAIFPSICLTTDDDLNTIDLKFKDGSSFTRKTWMIYEQASSKLKVIDIFTQYMKSKF